jgi:hypothetical protein
MKVVAKRIGFYGLKRRRAGEIFEIQSEKEFGSWMEKVEKEPVLAKSKSKAKAGRCSLHECFRWYG